MKRQHRYRSVIKTDQKGNSRTILETFRPAENQPNTGDHTGRRCYVLAGVSKTRKALAAAGVTAKRVRISGHPGWTEVIYTHQGGSRNSPIIHLMRLGFRVFRSPPAIQL